MSLQFKKFQYTFKLFFSEILLISVNQVTGLFDAAETPVYSYNDETIEISTSHKGVTIRYGSVTVEFLSFVISVTVPQYYRNKVC